MNGLTRWRQVWCAWSTLPAVSRGTWTTLSLRGASMVLGFVTHLLMARVYGPSLLGSAALAFSIFEVFIIAGFARPGPATIRFIAGFDAESEQAAPDTYRRIARLLFLLTSGGGLLLALLTPWISRHVFSKPDLAPQLYLLAGCFPLFGLYRVNINALLALRRFTLSAFLDDALFSVLSFTAILACAFFMPLSPFAITLSRTMAIAGACLATGWMTTRILPRRRRPVSTWSNRRFLRVLVPTVLSSLMFQIILQTDTLMLGVMRTGSEVGIYHLCVRLSGYLAIPMRVAATIAAAGCAEAYAQGRHEALRSSVRTAASLALLIPLIPALLLIFTGPFVLNLFGADFVEGRHALRLLAAGQVVYMLCGLNETVLTMTGHERLVRNIAVTAAILNIALNAIMIPRWGMVGAAMATAVCHGGWNLAGALLVRRIHGFWPGMIPVWRKVRTPS